MEIANQSYSQELGLSNKIKKLKKITVKITIVFIKGIRPSVLLEFRYLGKIILFLFKTYIVLILQLTVKHIMLENRLKFITLFY